MVQDRNQTAKNSLPRFFERGQFWPGSPTSSPVEVNRGMLIVSREGEEGGKVAAVVIDPDQQSVTHLVLARPQSAPDYRLVAVELIDRVNNEQIWLSISRETIENLPQR